MSRVDVSDHVDWTIRMIRLDGRWLSIEEAVKELTFDQLDAIGLCECGTWLDVHPKLPRPKPLGGWSSMTESLTPWRNTLTGKVYTPAQRAAHARSRLARHDRVQP